MTAGTAGPSTTTGPDLAALARRHGMVEVGGRPGLGSYLVQLWQRRDFIVTMARAGIVSANSQNRLGRFWLVLTPLMQGLVYAVIFGVLLNTRAGIENFIGYLVIGIFLFQYTAKALTDGSRAVTGNRKLIQVLSFPRAALPLSVSLRSMLTFVPALAAMFAVIVVAPEREVITWRWLLIVPVFALMSLFNLGLGLLAARVVASVNDISQVIPFGLRIWFYTSGVFFSFDRFAGGNPTLRAVLEANPMHVYLTLARDAILYGQDSPASYWLQAVAWPVVLVVVGFLLFWVSEERYTRE